MERYHQNMLRHPTDNYLRSGECYPSGNHYLLDKHFQNLLSNLVDSDLSSGKRDSPFPKFINTSRKENKWNNYREGGLEMWS